jgi:hypothetical protein
MRTVVCAPVADDARLQQVLGISEGLRHDVLSGLRGQQRLVSATSANWKFGHEPSFVDDTSLRLSFRLSKERNAESTPPLGRKSPA